MSAPGPSLLTKSSSSRVLWCCISPRRTSFPRRKPSQLSLRAFSGHKNVKTYIYPGTILPDQSCSTAPTFLKATDPTATNAVLICAVISEGGVGLGRPTSCARMTFVRRC
jgi:hypothetical protein